MCACATAAVPPPPTYRHTCIINVRGIKGVLRWVRVRGGGDGGNDEEGEKSCSVTYFGAHAVGCATPPCSFRPRNSQFVPPIDKFSYTPHTRPCTYTRTYARTRARATLSVRTPAVSVDVISPQPPPLTADVPVRHVSDSRRIGPATAMGDYRSGTGQSSTRPYHTPFLLNVLAYRIIETLRY